MQHSERANGDPGRRTLDPIVPDEQEPGAKGTVMADFWEMVRRLPRYLKLATAMSRDNRVPGRAKAMLIAAGAYPISPVDLVPGLIPVAGQLDDLYVILTALQQAVRMSPADVIDEHLATYALTRQDIEDDLAAVRALVREGARRGLRAGGRMVNRIRTGTMTLIANRRQRQVHRRESHGPL